MTPIGPIGLLSHTSIGKVTMAGWSPWVDLGGLCPPNLSFALAPPWSQVSEPKMGLYAELYGDAGWIMYLLFGFVILFLVCFCNYL